MTSTLFGSTELLSLATVLVAAAVVLPRLGGRWPLWILLLWRIAAFLALTVLVLNILGSPLDPHFITGHAGMNLWAQFIEACWWVRFTVRRCVGGTTRSVACGSLSFMTGLQDRREIHGRRDRAACRRP